MLMALLAIGLPTLQMQPGEIFSPQVSGPSTIGSSQGVSTIGWFWVVLQGLQFLLLVLLPIYIVVSLLSKKGRRKLMQDILKIAIIFLLAMWLSEMGPRLTRPEDVSGQQPGFMDFSGTSGNVNAPPSFVANPQPWMLALIIIGAAVLIAAITFYGLKTLFGNGPKTDDHFQDLADQAQAALNVIEAAKIDFDDVVIRCYAEMSQTLQAENGIQRAQAMTTHEFEQELLAKGFPTQPVRQLTQLFEQVRYGHQQPGEDAKQIATDSLREIIDFCRGQA